jgi:hypothetical protein
LRSQAIVALPGFVRLLLDECVDERLRLLFAGYDCQTARFANLAGLKNGRLPDAAEAAGFDVLITVDQSIPDQQNLSTRKISIVILLGATNRLKDLTPLVAAALSAISSIKQGQVLRIR